jgi:RecA-family ATPase
MLMRSTEHFENDEMHRIDSEYQTAVNAGLRGDADTPPFQTLYIDETHLVPPPEYLIEPWLVSDTVTCLYGQPGSFKSFFAVHAAMCLATGTPFNGKLVRKTPVIYLAAEGQGGIAMRQDAWKLHFGIYTPTL